MSTLESTFNMQVSNLLSGFVGALIGALASFFIAIYTNNKAMKVMDAERLRSHVATAVSLAGQLFDNYLSFNPSLLNQSSFGVRIEENSLGRMKYSIQLHGEAKYLQYLLPQILRHRWDMMLVLVSEFSTMQRLDGPDRNRAQVDVEHYIRYVRDSCVDFLDGKEVRSELERPYLNREDAVAWMPLDNN
jgi:hypothetical protein